MALTDLQVRKFKAQKRRFEVLDQAGLYVRVAPSGRKTWIFRYFFEGVPRRMQLGVFPGTTLAEAREKHGAALVEVQRGIDPGAKLQAEKAKRKAAPTVKDLLQEFWEIELRHKKSGTQTKKILGKDIVPAWGKNKVADIKRRDIVILLDRIAERGPIIRNRVHGALTRVFNFAAERGIIEDSPCTRIRKIPEKGRSRVLADGEIKALWKALDLENKDIDIYRVSKLALKMILLTGQRPGEVCGMTWDEVADNFWNIPAGRMKNNVLNRVPLCPMALEVLEDAKIYSGKSNNIFCSSYKPDRPLTRHALTRAVARHWPEMGIDEKFTPHDLRRTLRTRLAELGVNEIVAERVLGHKLQGMMAIYNQYPYDTEKRQALSLWERRLAEIIGGPSKPSNVIPFEVRHG
jgi:integrase